MAKENGEAKLKLVHLVYGLLAAAVIVGIAIGSMSNQQSINTKQLDHKLEKEVFVMHNTQQMATASRIDSSLDKINDKLDKLIEK